MNDAGKEQSPLGLSDLEMQPDFINFMQTAKRNAAVVRSRLFVDLARMHLTEIPIAGAAAYRKKSDGSTGILINWDYYEHGLETGENFTDCIDFEIEHEAYELWATREEKEFIDPFGPAHYDVIRHAMITAYQAGKVDRYMLLKRKQFELFAQAGDPKAMEELSFYEKYLEELKTVDNKT